MTVLSPLSGGSLKLEGSKLLPSELDHKELGSYYLPNWLMDWDRLHLAGYEVTTTHQEGVESSDLVVAHQTTHKMYESEGMEGSKQGWRFHYFKNRFGFV